MDVDESGGNSEAFCIKTSLCGRGRQIPYSGDRIALNTQIGVKPAGTGAVDHFAVGDEYVELRETERSGKEEGEAEQTHSAILGRNCEFIPRWCGEKGE